MGLFDRIRRKRRSDSGAVPDLRYLHQWAAARTGVEAYLEPVTMATETTLVLVAYDGEWTRRRVESPEEAADLTKKWGIPLYDTQKVGYPPRMREWTERNKRDRGTL